MKFSATQVSPDSWRLSLFPNVHLLNLIKHWSLRIITLLLLIIQTLKYPFFLCLLNISTPFYVPQFYFSCYFFFWIPSYFWLPTLIFHTALVTCWIPLTCWNEHMWNGTSPHMSWFQSVFFHMAYSLMFFKPNFSCYSIAQQKQLKVFLKGNKKQIVEIVEGRTIILELRIDSFWFVTCLCRKFEKTIYLSLS